MKKIITVICAAAFATVSAFAQVMEKSGMKNTAWTGFGNPFDGKTQYFGLTDTLQARVNRGNVTVEGMLSWSFLANYDNEGDVDNFVWGTTNRNPLALHAGYNNSGCSTGKNTNKFIGGKYSNAVNTTNALQDSYYVNFFCHLNKNFDLGVGTKLNWGSCPAPGYGAWIWDADAHNVQGGFSTAYDERGGVFGQTSSEATGRYQYNVDAPGTSDVVGFVHYANKYAKKAAGVRFVTDGDFYLELGSALPNGFNTSDPAINFGAIFAPCDWLKFGATMEGAFEEAANFYTGATIGAGNVVVDVYLAMDSLFTDVDDDEAYGTGVAVTFGIPSTKITLRPELGVNFFQYDEYTPAWYTGALFSLPFNEVFEFRVWGSFAQGSRDKRWDDSSATDDYDGGHIITARPSLKYMVSKALSLDGYFNFEKRKAFDGEDRNAWSTGIFCTYKF